MSRLRILIIDDSEDDAFLVVRQLRSAGYAIEHTHADSAGTMRAALAGGGWDVVTADYTMPQFSGPAALAIFRESGLDIPFIIVTGTIGEESAVALLKAGANDFVLKSNLVRLPTVIERELREADERRARRRAEEALRVSEERYALAARAASDGLWDWDIGKGRVFYSQRWKAILGYAEDEIGDSPEEWLKRQHPDERELVHAHLMRHLKGLSPHFEVEHRILHRNAGYRWILSRGIAVRHENGRAYRMAGSMTDITERRRAEEQLRHDALHDGLTGLPNRTSFTDLLRFALGHCARDPERQCAVLLLNLERFRLINDSFGHAVGDHFLVEVARRLRASLRPGDVIARFAADEFAILHDGLKDASAAPLHAERLQGVLAEPCIIDGHELFPVARMGIAFSTSGYDAPEDMLRDADTAMQRARSPGRARIEIFDPEMHAHAVGLLQLENSLRRAIDNGEFVPYYQPIIALVSGRIGGFEALVRWRHPTRGLVAPGEFIAIAEELGLINVIGRQVLHAACRQVSAWHAAYRERPCLSMSVNLSGRQFGQADLLAQIDAALAESGVDPAYLKLEITESILMENTASTTCVLERLRARNIQILMDDFGTGYSSLSYLHRFPIDTLKIDCSFVGRLDEDPGGAEIVRTIIVLAHSLGMGVIAEGVETAEQLRRLRAFGCDCAQGFHFSPPVDAETAGRLVADDPRW